MIISTGIDNGWPNNELIMRWREKNELGNWIRKEKFVEDFYPYVYINPERAKIKSKLNIIQVVVYRAPALHCNGKGTL